MTETAGIADVVLGSGWSEKTVYIQTKDQRLKAVNRQGMEDGRYSETGKDGIKDVHNHHRYNG